MRKLTMLLIFVFSASLVNYAQERGFHYKAQLSNTSGVLKTQSVDLVFSLFDVNNNEIYRETQSATTDNQGMIDINIGEGEAVIGDFSKIDWSKTNYQLNVSIDTGEGFRDFGTTSFQSVPYAKYAEKAGNVFSGSFNDLTDVPENFGRGTNDVQSLNDLTDAKTNLTSVYLGSGSGQSNVGIYNYNTATGRNALKNNTSGNHNTAMGNGSMFSNTTGYNNTAYGFAALYHATTSRDNTAIGKASLYNNTTGIVNTAIGYWSLYNNTTGNSNTAVGKYALKDNTGGGNNVAVGTNCLVSNTTGNYNTAMGVLALNDNTTGYANVANGYAALYKNASGHDNIAIGNSALYNSNGGDNNIAIGYRSLNSNNSSTNIGIGKYALYSNTSGYGNIGIGRDVLHNNTHGQRDVAMGENALRYNTTGNFNTAIGATALYHNQTGANNTAVGKSAYFYGNYSNSTAIGHNASITANNMVKLGDNSVTWIGGHAPWYNTSDGRFKRNVKENVPGLSFITQLRPVSYTWDNQALDRLIKAPENNDDSHRQADQIVHTGLIAQEVAKAAEKLGFDFDGVHKPENETDPYSLSYAQLVVPLIKAVQEQQAQIDLLKKEIQQLKNTK